ncbi:MAG: T9SS type A sorting domain-containing protein [Bacteroidales bacterium]|nr:T9SS type A sorting domain-containing protein [Bacteroidales bacterium]
MAISETSFINPDKTSKRDLHTYSTINHYITHLKKNIMIPSMKSTSFMTLFSFALFLNIASAQTYPYFQDSPDSEIYDYSWLWVNEPSELEIVGADNHRFPVETATPPQQGMNSLRLKWKSVATGNWQAIVAGSGWAAKNVSDTDTLLFYFFSGPGLNAASLPLVFLEDTQNIQTTGVAIGDYSGNIPPGVWFRITIPMEVFLNAGDPVDFTAIKTIGFGQNVSDNVQHTLFVDDMRIFKGDGSSTPVAAPQGLTARGYDSHVYLTWQPNTESNLNGYEIYQSINGGASFAKRAVVGKYDTIYTDFVREQGTNLTLKYKLTALNDMNEPSGFSNTVDVSTYDMTDDELLEMVQEATFRYFYDFAHPASGMARERNTSGNTVTSGGTGFGIMALLVGVERGFITRDQGVAHITKILNFLETADRFHGVWPHWLNGNTGQVIPFSEKDNGGDLVETAFLVQGLLAARQYFDQATSEEQAIVQKITTLWETVEWDWYRKDGGNYLYWHWSPTYGWDMNMQVRGPNEAAVIYLLAIASPTYGVPASLWHDGWASSSYYENGKFFYGYQLWVGWDYGGPLFFAHYSYLGFDPRNIKDQYANYFQNNKNHTLINRAYCIANPKSYEGYGENCWGLTASDDPYGYMAHEPTSDRDNGTITPTAALSSMPYTPVESLGALKHFYRNLGDKIWGNYGFTDSFNEEVSWYATSYLAIDQGPIIDMIENYRSGLLWEKFMANPEIQPALDAIGFVYDPDAVEENGLESKNSMHCFPNPAGKEFTIEFKIDQSETISVELLNLFGEKLQTIIEASRHNPGTHLVEFSTEDTPSGFYLVRMNIDGSSFTEKLIIQK